MSSVWTVADDINYLNLEYAHAANVEEIEGKGSPNETEFGAESSSYQQGGHAGEICSGGGGGRGEFSRRTSSSLSHHSDVHPDHKGHHSDSTSISKAPATSSCSPSDSPAHRLSEHSRTRSKSVGEQQWTNLRAVMAWYSRLRRIKRSKSNQRWMKLRTTVQLSGAIQTIQKKAPLKREDSFLKRFSTRQIPEAQETFELGDEDGNGAGGNEWSRKGRKKRRSLPRSVVNPDGNFYFYWLMLLTFCVLYNLWTLIVRQSFPELQAEARLFWILADVFSDLVFLLDIAVQFRTGYLEQGLMVWQTKKLAKHYIGSKPFYLDLCSLVPTDLFQLYFGINPMFRFPRFLKIYRIYNYYYMVESRTVYPNVWRVVNLIHILLLLAHWFGCFYYLISEAEKFEGHWGYPHPEKYPDFAPLTRKYLGSLYWSTLTLTTIGDLPPPHSNWQFNATGNTSMPYSRPPEEQTTRLRAQSHKSRLHYISSNTQNASTEEIDRLVPVPPTFEAQSVSRLLYIRSDERYLFTIVSYLIGVFIFATIVGQVGNVITNRNANRLEFERLLGKITEEKIWSFIQNFIAAQRPLMDGAKMYMRHHKVPRDMQRRVLRWYDYSWSRGRIQGGGDINTALGLLPDKLKTELALHVNLSVLKKVTIFQECQPEFLHDLVLKMKAYIFTPGDLICRKGEVAREMFIIADGILEVISETGRVLTTMQAGDFFGEIGILNLDGLNKRTADVRSVGYSELFSLSREDVLAAMKDYPEAQEILQTLGRKRLMEARKASGPATKKVITIGGPGMEAKKTSPIHVGLSRSQSSHSNKELPDGSTSTGVPVDTNAGKRIVEKLRSDVKGLRNAIRRSRKSNSSKEDSSEPESGKPDVEAGGSRGRKESVRDAKSFPPPRGVLKRMHNVLSDEKDKDPSTSPSTSTPSPAMKIKVGGFASTVKRLQQPKKSAPPPEPEIIGAGLPLIQRLRLLKQKEDRERKQQEEREAMMKTLIPSNLSLASPTVSPIRQTQASVETPPVMKTMDPATALANVVERARVERASISSNESSSAISSPPTTHPFLGTFSPKSNLLIGEAAAVAVSKVTAEPIPIGSSGTFTPLWASSPPRGPGPSSGDIVTCSSVPSPHIGSDRPSALHFRHQHTSKNYGSVDDLSPEFSRLPFIKKLKILNERQKIAELLLSKSANSVLTRSTSEGSNENPSVPVDFLLDTSLHSVQMGRRTQSNKEQLQIDDEEGASISQYFSQQATPLSESSKRLDNRQSGMDALSIKRGESSTAVKVKTSKDSNTTICLKGDSSPSTSAPTGKAKVRKRRKVKKVQDDGNEGSTEDSSPSPPLSPEGETNETPERRNLKSILKKLAETGTMDGKDQDDADDRHLLKSHTVEGYAARHRKFAKNVTFRRQAVTVVSPQGPTTPITASDRSHGVLEEQIHGQSRLDRFHAEGGTTTTTTTVTGAPTRTGVLPSTVPFTRPFSPENMKTLSSLLMVKGDEMVLTLGEEDRPHFQGLNVAQEECIGSVVLGIKTIIQSKMDEIQCKFQNRFESLEHEVRQRDEIISILQQRIQELENRDLESGSFRRVLRNGKSLQINHIEDGRDVEGELDGDMEEDNEDEDSEFRSNRLLPQMQSSYLFSRGDSIDTVISAQDYDDEVFERTEMEFREAREGLSHQVQTEVPTNHQTSQNSRRDTTGSNGRQNYVSSWANEQDTIEMRDLSPAPWQLEFHRDRDSLPPPNGSRDAVAVEIGNTSTEYESSSSEDGGHRGIENPMAGGVQLQERKVSLDDEDYDELEVEDSDSDQSEKSDDLNNKNWEVLLLAKEMEKQEEKRRTTEEVVGEMRELENEIEEMKDVVNTGSLSPSELDMLESILESKSKRMKALYKALSVESGSTAATSHRSTYEPTSPKSKVGRSHEDFRRSSAGPTHFPQSLTPAGLGQPTLHPRSALNLGIFSRASSTSEKGSRLSPGEKLDLQRLIFSHKGGGVKRQASLCEPSESSSSSANLRERRRESAGAIPFPQPDRSSRKSSFFSRFSLMRQLTSIGRHGTHQPVPESSYEPESQPLPTFIPPEERTDFDSSNLSRKASSSVGILPMISSTIASALSSSVKSDPGQRTEASETVTISGTTTIVVVNTTTSMTGATLTTPSHPGVFTIPSISFPPAASAGQPHSSSDSKQLLGESQPLLKK